jgi:hypothetical protein
VDDNASRDDDKLDRGSGVILIDNLMAVEKITEYGVRWAGTFGEEIITQCATLNGAVRYAEKVSGCLMERVTYVTGWEPYFGEPDPG